MQFVGKNYGGFESLSFCFLGGSLIYSEVAPSDIVSSCKVMGSDRSPTPIRIVLGCNLLVLQLFQYRCEESPSSIELVAPDEKPPFPCNGIEEEPLICIWDLLGVPDEKTKPASINFSVIHQIN